MGEELLPNPFFNNKYKDAKLTPEERVELRVVDEFDNWPPEPLPPQLVGERLDLSIRQLIRDVKINYLEIGGLLAEMWQSKVWGQTGYDKWSDYCESLGLGSYSYIQSLIAISKLVVDKLLTPEEIIEIGYSKACLLIPMAARGELTDDLIALSKVCTNRDLRLQLNYHVRENDEDSHVICPGCGTKIIGAAWKKKE